MVLSITAAPVKYSLSSAASNIKDPPADYL